MVKPEGTVAFSQTASFLGLLHDVIEEKMKNTKKTISK